MKNLGDLMKQARKLQEQMEKLAEERVSASTGGGAVEAVVDGRLRLVELKIKPEAIKDGDVELLEDLIMAAVHEAQAQAEERMRQAMGPLAGGMGLPS